MDNPKIIPPTPDYCREEAIRHDQRAVEAFARREFRKSDLHRMQAASLRHLALAIEAEQAHTSAQPIHSL